MTDTLLHAAVTVGSYVVETGIGFLICCWVIYTLRPNGPDHF